MEKYDSSFIGNFFLWMGQFHDAAENQKTHKKPGLMNKKCLYIYCCYYSDIKHGIQCICIYGQHFLILQI